LIDDDLEQLLDAARSVTLVSSVRQARLPCAASFVSCPTTCCMGKSRILVVIETGNTHAMQFIGQPRLICTG
jgi:hypothetical protein